MPKTLSKRDVGRLEPRDKSYVLWDPGLQGFGIRVPTTGAKTFVVKVRVGHGRFAEQHWITIGRCGPLSLDKARAEARLIIARAMTGQEPASRRKVSEAEVMTVEDLKKNGWRPEHCALALSAGGSVSFVIPPTSMSTVAASTPASFL
jgi:hypothetical protein